MYSTKSASITKSMREFLYLHQAFLMRKFVSINVLLQKSKSYSLSIENRYSELNHLFFDTNNIGISSLDTPPIDAPQLAVPVHVWAWVGERRCMGRNVLPFNITPRLFMLACLWYTDVKKGVLSNGF